MKNKSCFFILLGFIVFSACKSNSEEHLKSFFVPDLILINHSLPTDNISLREKVFDKKHRAQLIIIINKIKIMLNNPKTFCSPSSTETKVLLLSLLADIDPLLEQSWAIKEIHSIINILFTSYKTLDCPTSPPKNAVFQDCVRRINHLDNYLQSL